MRVRMLQDHEETHIEPGVGPLTLRYAAGETHHFHPAVAKMLIDGKKAADYPPEGRRVRVTRLHTEREFVEAVNAQLDAAKSEAPRVTVAGAPDQVFTKGPWHVSNERADWLAKLEFAVEEPDPDEDGVAATRTAVIAQAKATQLPLPAAKPVDAPAATAAKRAPAPTKVTAEG